jgi:uncharacterized membrane protein
MKYFPPLKLNSCEYIARILRHWLAFSWRVKPILSASERERIADIIEASEKNHTAEIAVAIEARLPWTYLKRNACARERAWNAFGKMQVWDTPQNNGVLIYLLWADKRIEIVADRALAQVIPQSQWSAWVYLLNQHAKQRTWGDGLARVISEMDIILCQHFPQTAQYTDDNRSSNRPEIF